MKTRNNGIYLNISHKKRNERGKEGRRKINRALLKGVIVCVCKKKKCQKFRGKTFCDAYTKDKTIKLEKKKRVQPAFQKFHHICNIFTLNTYKNTHGTKNQKPKRKGRKNRNCEK